MSTVIRRYLKACLFRRWAGYLSRFSFSAEFIHDVALSFFSSVYLSAVVFMISSYTGSEAEHKPEKGFTAVGREMET